MKIAQITFNKFYITEDLTQAKYLLDNFETYSPINVE